jgi:hypothetical protein
MVRRTPLALCVAALGAALSAAPAHADLAKLSATYDGSLEDSVFTITNDSAVSETVILRTSLGPTTTVLLPNLAAGASETYTFNAVNGGYINDPQSAGVPDTTTYALLIGLNNGAAVLSSGFFSPISNLTGTDVDFLGNQCDGFAGGACGTTYALSGTVASVPLSGTVASVPEPVSASLLLVGLGGLGLLRRQRA